MLSQWNVRTRLWLGFGGLLLLAIGIALFAMRNLQQTTADVEDLVSEKMANVARATEIKDNINVVARGLRNLALMTERSLISDQPAKTAERKRIDEVRARNSVLIKELQDKVQDTRGRELLTALVAARDPYGKHLDRALEISTTGTSSEAVDYLLKDMRTVQSNYFKAIDEFGKEQREQMKSTANTVGQRAQQVGAVMMGLALLATVAGLGLMMQISRSITQPLAHAVSLAQRIRDGDLATSIQPHSRDEMGQLLSHMAEMQDSLRQLVANVRANATQVATAATQIAQGNQDLSARTEQQASAVQETSSTMEQLGSTVSHNANSTRQANELAHTATAVATKGGEVVAQVVETMRGINESSHRIADIISVIDGIAFQTNILALNAAVEAARAGEQGRGFAVVAGEVRSLAQRSAEAAREIKGLITASVERVGTGTVLVDQAGNTMNDVVQAIRQVSQIVGEISAATTEQNESVQQITQAMGQMDQATQQNAALVEESAAAAMSLQTQAQQLAHTVSGYQV
jgi:methyl-accepting chemotaxis protein